MVRESSYRSVGGRVKGDKFRRVKRVLAALSLASFGCTPPDSSLEEVARRSLSRLDGEIRLAGLEDEVEVIRDRHGIPHVYAKSLEDLFFAQGFVVAQDRLWQMEVWRRWSEGRMAELIGDEGFAHDRLVRMLRYRGPVNERELTRYHPDGEKILSSFARGINAFLEERRDNLPVEFQLTGLTPEPWTAETVLLRARVSAVVSQARSEIRLARAVAELGVEEANAREDPDPFRELVVPEGLDVSVLTEAAAAALEGDLYGEFPRVALLPRFGEVGASSNEGARETSPGSNNWAVSPELTATGKGFMVDDPHREVSNPAHRYMIHLVAPGWNVIGATESTIPGVIRGHNGRIAWGRTATGSDQADVFIERLNPEDPGEVLYRGEWEPLEVVVEEIVVRGEGAPRRVEIEIGRHGPIFYKDVSNGIAYALRSKLQEPGTAEYLGGLRLDQASSVEECLAESAYLVNPPTNLVCADADGNVGWTIAALSPRRRGWDGRLPDPGTGDFEWDGFRDDLPRTVNPPEGFLATANNNTHPPDYDPPLFFVRGSPRYRRYERIRELLGSKTGFTREDMRDILHDALSTEAVESKPSFEGWTSSDPAVERARQSILDWDGRMKKESAAAAIFFEWRNAEEVEGAEARLAKALEALRGSQGDDESEWRWGRLHRSEFPHPLASAFDLPSVERDGGFGTVNATGAVYRLVTDFSDLDRSLAIIAPGQSGQPESPYYSNLLDMWVRGEMFELPYSREAVEREAAHELLLRPR
jgi:penicillin amidase